MPLSGKKWYQVWWKLLLMGVSTITFIWGILVGVYKFTEWWHNEQLKEKKIEALEQTLLDVINEDKTKDKKIQELEQFVQNKSRSYAVGFRVFNDVDPITKVVSHRKMYRDWDGVWHEVHKDYEYSQMYGVDYYYYIEKNTGRKKYCW